ncbi:hypothetical protein [Nocardiopsis potens]|uniref:hypothetical protein n=1 Tax=Nocardiopsis potens TaxID=1246458 RepID=UPI0003491674|nr:hypothetical protein [Nocardiopsis potens]
MEFIDVPWVAVVRAVGPAAVLFAVGAVLLVRRRPARRGLVWAALAVQLAAAALPFGWLLAQAGAGIGGRTEVGLAMILVQPGLEAAAWALLLVAAVGGLRRVRPAAGGPPAAETAEPVTDPVR